MKAVFMDRDGVIWKPPKERLYDYAKAAIYDDDVPKSLAQLGVAGYTSILIGTGYDDQIGRNYDRQMEKRIRALSRFPIAWETDFADGGYETALRKWLELDYSAEESVAICGTAAMRQAAHEVGIGEIILLRSANWHWGKVDKATEAVVATLAKAADMLLRKAMPEAFAEVG